MRRSNRASALQHVPELTWILFLRILDVQEAREREVHAAQAKADAIDAACYDLKAVNPHAREERDLRTPDEVLDSIAASGKSVDEALARLRMLLATDAGAV